jgi:seryl-tRNA synthetase
MNDKIDQYLSIHKELNELKKKQANLRKNLKMLDVEIKKHMQENNLNVLTSQSGGVITLYEKKIPQTFKKENIINKLSEKLQNVPLKNTTVSDIADSLFQNVFVIEEEIKPVLKK